MYVLLIIGILLRLTLWFVNPIGNGYDDHLEPIHIYSLADGKPDVAECWQCYQPPLYYFLAGSLKRFLPVFTMNPVVGWKIIQLINPILSILILLIIFRYIRRYVLNQELSLLIFSFAVFIS